MIGSIRQVLDQALQGVAASVGNLGATEDSEKVSRIFDQLFFIGYWIYGFAGICLFELLNPFVELAFGKQYLFQREVVLVLCINFFVNGTRKAVLIFKESILAWSVFLPEPSAAQCLRLYGWSLTSFIDIVSRNRFGSILEDTACILSLWQLPGQLQNFAAR